MGDSLLRHSDLTLIRHEMVKPMIVIDRDAGVARGENSTS